MQSKRLKLTLTVAALSLGSVGTSLADDVNELEEVIVNARRVEERLQDVPISMSVFDQEQLAERNVLSGRDLATYTPSLSTNARFGTQNASFAIRGFTQEIRTTASVGMYFADVVARRGGASTTSGDGAGPGNFFDLQNVQVLKGPQGTLFGRNTTGGAVLLVPQKPTSEFEGYIEPSYGNYEMLRMQAVLNAPLGERVRLRLGVDDHQREGYLKNISGVGPDRFGDVDYTAARASVVVDITDNVENYTIGSYLLSDTIGDIPQLYVCNPAASPFGALACAQVARTSGRDFYTVENGDPTPQTRSESWQVINTTTWLATDTLTIKNIVSYAELVNDNRSEIFGDNFILPAATGPFAGQRLIFTNLRGAPGMHVTDQSTFTEELQLQGRSENSRFLWQAGVYYEQSDALNPNGAQSPQTIVCADSANFRCVDVLGVFAGRPGAVGTLGYRVGEIEYRDWAVYGQASYKLTDPLTFTLGLRYTEDRTESATQAAVYRFPAPNTPVPSCISTLAGNPRLPVSSPAVCELIFENETSAPTWVIGFDYAPSDSLMLYTKYSRGYRMGSVNPFGADGYNTFDEEQVDTYEIGAKTSFKGAVSGTFNIAAFYNDFQDQQLQVNFSCSTQCVSGNTGIVNAGKSRIYGVEVDSSVALLSSLSLSVSYAYLNTKLEELEPVTLLPGSLYDTVLYASVPGSVLPLTPKHKASATLAYQLPVPEQWGEVRIGTTYTYTDEQLVSSATPFGVLPSYELLNLNLSWNSIGGAPIDASVFATNVTEGEYATYVTGTYNVAGFESRVLGESRMYGARLRWRF